MRILVWKNSLTRLALIFIIISSAILFSAFQSQKSTIKIDRSVAGKDDYSYEVFSIVMSGETTEEEDVYLREITDWQNQIISDLEAFREEGRHFNLKVDGEVKDGKTILRYYGTVTNEAGEEEDYLDEKTFNIVLDKDLF